MKLMETWMKLSVFVVCVACVVCEDKCANSTVSVVNCQMTNQLHADYNNAFAPACTKHDVCYKCGSGIHKDKEKCDNIFLEELDAICKSLDGAVYNVNACPGVAGVFYSLVYGSGDFTYHETPLSFCSDFWVALCLGSKIN